MKKICEVIKGMLLLIFFLPLCFLWVCALIWAVMLPWLILYCLFNIDSVSDWYEVIKLTSIWFASFGVSCLGIALFNLGEENK